MGCITIVTRRPQILVDNVSAVLRQRLIRLFTTAWIGWSVCLPAAADDVSPPDGQSVAGESINEKGESFPPLFEPTRFPLDFVSDRTDLVGDADIDAYYGLLDYVRKVDPAALRQAAADHREQRWNATEFADWPLEEFPLYFDLTQNPKAYRGKPIALTGHVQLHHADHPENDFGLDPVHIAYLYTDDSQNHPARIVFTENPDNVPVGEQVVSGITTTGYFFKLYRYEDREGKGRFMPLILARSIRWSPPQPTQLSPLTQLVIAASVIAIIAIVFWGLGRARLADAEAREREKQLLGDDLPPDFSALS